MDNGVFYGSGNILGYRRKETIDDNNKKHVDFLVEPKQAETVKMIFGMYLDGHGLMQIKNELERQGRLTAMGKTNWHCTVISHVLKKLILLWNYHLPQRICAGLSRSKES